MQTEYQVPKLTRLERLLFTALTEHGPQTLAELSKAVQVASLQYLKSSLRVLQFAGVVLQDGSIPDKPYRAVPAENIGEVRKVCQPVPPIDKDSLLLEMATQALEATAALAPDRLVSWRTLYKSQNWQRGFGAEKISQTLATLIQSGKVTPTRFSQLGKITGKVRVN